MVVNAGEEGAEEVEGLAGVVEAEELRLGKSQGRQAGSLAAELKRCCYVRCGGDGSRLWVAEGEGFEPPVSCPTTVFKTVALNRSAIPPSS